MGVKGKQSISYIYSQRALLLPAGIPRLVELVEWLRRRLLVIKVQGSNPTTSAPTTFVTSSTTKISISYMLTQVGFVLLPYGPGFVSWLDLRASSPICLGACTSMTSITSGTIGGGAAPCGASIVASTEMRYTTSSRRTTERIPHGGKRRAKYIIYLNETIYTREGLIFYPPGSLDWSSWLSG